MISALVMRCASARAPGFSQLKILLNSTRDKSTSIALVDLANWEKKYVERFSQAHLQPMKCYPQKEVEIPENEDEICETVGAIRLAKSENISLDESRNLIMGKIEVTQQIFDNQKSKSVKLLDDLGYKEEAEMVDSLPFPPKKETFWSKGGRRDRFRSRHQTR